MSAGSELQLGLGNYGGRSDQQIAVPKQLSEVPMQLLAETNKKVRENATKTITNKILIQSVFLL